MPHIRKAGITDAANLAKLAERTFRDAFEESNTPEDLALHCNAHYGEAIQHRELSDLAVEILVCEHEATLIAYAQLRTGKPPACVTAQRPIEIQRFYVSKDWHGKGLAHELMTAAIKRTEQRGADQVWLGVWEHNPRAIAFYRKWGFAEVGDHIFPLGTDPQRDIVMTRNLLQAT
jgi:ribosomal protein S18 acetylase RimI-like enzyme